MPLGPGSRACSVAFLAAAATLSLQVLVHRMVSAKLLNNFAFFIISLTMLGFALSGVVLSRWLGRILEGLDEALTVCAALTALSTLVAVIAFYRADVGPAVTSIAGRWAFVAALLRWIPRALLYALPFAFCGLMLGALLSAPHLSTRRVYFFDLMGSAAGAFGVIPAISVLGVERSALVVCAVLLLGTVVLAPPRRPASRLVAATAGLALLLCGAARERAFEMRYRAGSVLAEVQRLEGPEAIEYIAWDPVARIEVSRVSPPDPSRMYVPSLAGDSRSFLRHFKRLLTQNNYAYTYAVEYDGNKHSLQGIDDTLYAAAYRASSVARPGVLVIGVGGGFDVLTALFFDAARVRGVEVNAATIEILTHTYRDYFRKWVEDPRVQLVLAEGRHFLAATDERFDVIQLSGVDSYSGTAGAAHVFSENYLYTSEAFDLYLSHLTGEGIVNLMRLEYVPPREMLRALTTAVSALRRAGVERPSDHVAMLTDARGSFAAMLVKKTPFTEAEVQRLESWASRNKLFSLSAAPRMSSKVGNAYRFFLALGDPRLEQAFVAGYPFDVAPVDDDRPFFFRYSFWWHLLSSRPVVQASIPAMEYSLLVLFAVVCLAALLCVYAPLKILTRKGPPPPGAWRYGLFCAGTGLGYLAIEIALLQKFGLVLGHPNYALSVVLASLLLATGLGSLFSETLVGALGNLRFISYILAGIVLAEYGLVFPRLPALVGLPFGARCALVLALVAPIGTCLGTFLPSALERLKRSAPGFVPWAWGVNGIFSVLAPILSVGFSMTWGINALLLAAIPIYLAVGFSLGEAQA